MRKRDRENRISHWGGLGRLKNRAGGLDGVEPKIVEITHLCIMHVAHTSINCKGGGSKGKHGKKMLLF
jgi:hypothetical protein